MDDLEYKKKILDTKSASFCGAKWYNATIWLGSGMTTSCHHPLPHKIDLEEIKTNPSAIHNTREKKEQRRQMQSGDRPAGCEYCWKIEDMGRDAISDRVYKSKFSVTRIYKMHLRQITILTTISKHWKSHLTESVTSNARIVIPHSVQHGLMI